jgi:GAF domain/ANTAR domain
VTDYRLAQVLAFIADHGAARRSVMSSQLACDACVRLVDVTGAGLSLMNGADRGESRYATDEVGTRIEEAQFTLGEGPSLDAFRSAMPVLVAELGAVSSHRRWPLFAPAALEAGVQAVFAFPLRAGAVRLGALVLHRTWPEPLTSEQMSDALVVTDVILSLLLDELTSVPPGPGQLRGEEIMLRGAEIHQATGMVSAQLDVTVEEALVRLRAHAFARELPIADVAREVVARRLRLTREPDPDST